MRKVLLVAAAAAIALVGLSANTCGGEEKQAAPELPPPAAAPEAPAADAPAADAAAPAPRRSNDALEAAAPGAAPRDGSGQAPGRNRPFYLRQS